MALSNRATSEGFNHLNSGAVSFPHTPIGTPDFVVVTVNFGSGGSVPFTSGPTYGGNAMTQVAEAGQFSRTSTMWVLASPPSGVQTVASQVGVQHTVRCVTYTGVDVGGTPYNVLLEHQPGAISTYSQVVSSAVGREVLVCVAKNQIGTTTPGAGQTVLETLYEDDGNGCGNYLSYMDGASSLTISGTSSGGVEFMGVTALEILPAAGGGGSVAPGVLAFFLGS